MKGHDHAGRPTYIELKMTNPPIKGYDRLVRICKKCGAFIFWDVKS